MLGLHNLVSGLVGSVNPMQLATWYKCLGFTTAPGGKSTPSFMDAQSINVQVQQLTVADLKHIDGLNVSGITRKVWSEAILSGIDRAAQLGGDKLVLKDGTTWLVVQIIETWPDWCSAVIQKQVS